MAYNSSTGIITAPISIDDVKSALGLSTNDVATLCTSSKINKWSKYKPISYAKNFDVSDTERKSVRWGNTVEDRLRFDEIFAGNSNWGYKLPTGGASSPYRLGDFVGYNAKASMPLNAVFPDCINTNGVRGSENLSTSFSFGLLNNTDANCVHLDDILQNEELDYYFTIMLNYSSSYYIKTASNSIRQMIAAGTYGTGLAINLGDTPFYNLASGIKIKAVCCLQPTKIDSGSTSISNSPNMISVEYESGVSVKEIPIVFMSPDAGISFDITAKTSSSTDINVSSCTITFNWDKDWGKHPVYISIIANYVSVNLGTSTTTTTDSKEIGNSSVSRDGWGSSATGTKTIAIPISSPTNWSQSGNHGSSSITAKVTIVGATTKVLTKQITIKGW